MVNYTSVRVKQFKTVDYCIHEMSSCFTFRYIENRYNSDRLNSISRFIKWERSYEMFMEAIVWTFLNLNNSKNS